MNIGAQLFIDFYSPFLRVNFTLLCHSVQTSHKWNLNNLLDDLLRIIYLIINSKWTIHAKLISFVIGE